jgi:hypothetical protein
MPDTKEPEGYRYASLAYTEGSEAILPGENGGMVIFDFYRCSENELEI